jgi:hypothetical protein
MSYAEVAMRGAGKSFVLCIATVVLALVCGPTAKASDWKDTLKDELEKSYPLTHRATLSPDRITQEGTVLLIEKPGIAADPSSDMRYSVTYVRDGQIGEQGGATSAIFTKTNTRVFKPGEKVYVTAIKIGDDYVMLELMSCDMFDIVHHGSTKQTRYKAALSFKFEGDSLSRMPVDKVQSIIAPVVATESQAATANTKTVSLGQTEAQVKSALGAPDKVINLGAKLIYVYKDIKVVFNDGKVVDVQ